MRHTFTPQTTRATDLRIGGALLFVAGSLILLGIITAEALYPLPYTTGGNEIRNLGGTEPPAALVFQPFATIFDVSMIVVGLMDVEAAAALARPSRTPTASESLAFLEDLPMLWAETSDAGRRAIAEATSERVDVLGVTDYTFTLTAHARARGWDAAFGPASSSRNKVILVGARGLGAPITSSSRESWSSSRIPSLGGTL